MKNEKHEAVDLLNASGFAMFLVDCEFIRGLLLRWNEARSGDVQKLEWRLKRM